VEVQPARDAEGIRRDEPADGMERFCLAFDPAEEWFHLGPLE
jgi:hypothetical protein